MAQVLRMRVAWTGAQVVGPGVTTLYCDPTAFSGWAAGVLALFNAVKGNVPTGITWDIPSVVDAIEVSNADLVSGFTIGGGGTVASAGGPGDYKPGVGGRIRWSTAGVVGGRRVTGTTFLVPMLAGDTLMGVLGSSIRTSIATAANAYVSAAGFTPMVYSPRVFNAPDPKGKNRDGAVSEITGASVPAGITWLRTRRT